MAAAIPAVQSSAGVCSLWQSLLVEPVISDVGRTNSRIGLCRPVSDHPTDGS